MLRPSQGTREDEDRALQDVIACSGVSNVPPLEHERGPSQHTPLIRPTDAIFHASYHIQNTRPDQNVSKVRYTAYVVCGRSVDAIKRKKLEWYMQRSTPSDEPEQVTRLRKEAYENGLIAGSFLFLTSAVSQAAACDGRTLTTTANDQQIAPGTLPTF